MAPVMKCRVQGQMPPCPASGYTSFTPPPGCWPFRYCHRQRQAEQPRVAARSSPAVRTYPGLIIYHLMTPRECVRAPARVFSCKCESNFGSVSLSSRKLGLLESSTLFFSPCNWSDGDSFLITQYLAHRDILVVFPSNYITLCVFKLTGMNAN